MKKLSLIPVSVLVLMLLFVSAACASLPECPAEFNTDVAAPSFSMTAPGGRVVTSEDFGAGKNLLLIYGRVYCGNTQAFLGGIEDELDLLAANGVTVMTGLHDDPEDAQMIDFSDFFGGVPCYKVSYDYYESGMWTGLAAAGADTGSVTFPVIFLRSADGRLRYYSTGYVYNPSAVVSAAIVMAGGNPLRQAAEIVLPDDLEEIKEGAFRGDSFTSVYCGGNVSSIGAYAFAENKSLEWIYLPASVTTIDRTAFSECPQELIICGKAGSRAQEFAEDNGFDFRER